MTDTDPRQLAIQTQRAAADPAVSSWVSASAGSGKTKVLTDRVLNLLLDGTPPSRILCVTFTKAAAAEMSNRIQERLGDWAAKPKDKLCEDLKDLLGDRYDEAYVAVARRLFADVLDAPDSLRIQTLHGFCQSILRRFPLEAALPPHFDLLTDTDAKALMAEAEEAVLSPDLHESDLLEALAFVTARQHETRFGDLMRALVQQRSAYQAMRERYGTPDAIFDAVSDRLGISSDATFDTVLDAACDDLAFDGDGLRAAAEAMLAGSKTDIERAEKIVPWLANPPHRAETFFDYLGGFLTGKSQPFAKPCTKGTAETFPAAPDILAEEAARLVQVLETLNAITVRDASWALAVIADAMLTEYDSYKEAGGTVDYDDLIGTTGALLSRSAMAAWVLFKLDGGIDHVLIDEAQDTNTAQWTIINALTEEFFAGLGRDNTDDEARARTLFAVGDRKQSIFRFQGADPTAFDAMRTFHGDRVTAAEHVWRPETLAVSFRSAPAVLQAVNEVFREGSEARQGVADPDENITHIADREGAAGRVEVWPLVEPEDDEQDAPWRPPVESLRIPTAQERTAELVAARIAHMIKTNEPLESKGRPITAGDILVLVRKRSGFVDDLVRNLKALDVPIAGADRLTLTDHIAVMDLMALGQVMLLPEDDLTLAAVLKSPLVGLSEEELFSLAYERSGTLWEALVAEAGAETSLGRAHEYLEDLRAAADFVAPFAFYSKVLNDGGRKKMLSRLGDDAADPIDAFLDQALAFERDHPPSLQGFLHWLALGETEIKRELDQSSIGAVRIMTVHGAKGLQAPIVFLPDTTSRPQNPSGILIDNETELVLWAPRVDDMDPVTKGLRDKLIETDTAEAHRLLYVAMTRAEDRLVVCGWNPKNSRPAGSWYDLIKEGLAPAAQKVDDPFLAAQALTPTSETLVISSRQKAKIEEDRAAQRLPDSGGALPGWATQPPAAEPIPPRPLAPAETDDDGPALPPFSESEAPDPYARGRVIHLLLEHLPDVAPDQRDQVGKRLAQQAGQVLSDDESASAVLEALAILSKPQWAALFGPNSRAEVPVTGLIDGHVVSGRLDRLAVDGSTVWIADYKTNRPPPASLEATPKAYLRQLAAYRSAIGAVYPGHQIKCLLVWTHTGTAMEVPDGLLDHAGTG